MTKKFFVPLSIAICLLIGDMASAASATHTGVVSRIYPTGSGSSGRIQFRLKDSNSCPFVHSGHYYKLLRSHGSFEESFALLMAAAETGQRISVRIDNAACTQSMSTSEVIYVYRDY